MRPILALPLLLLALHSAASSAQTSKVSRVTDLHEARASRAFEAARKQGPLALRNFLVGMPKGADLHVHLSGAVYAESFLRAAGEDGLCIDDKALSFAKPAGKLCAAGQVAAADMLTHMQVP